MTIKGKEKYAYLNKSYNDNMTQISIIIPIYNVEPYLIQCLDSIINQTYKNLEIILVDDGSPDNCGKICDEYAEKDNRIKVIHKENGGLSSARNAGLDIATGEFISFIDSDDYVSENFIERLYNLCKENDTDISMCDFLKFEKQIEKEKITCKVECYTSYEIQDKIFTDENVKMTVVWNKLYKRYIYDNLRFPQGKINEDEFTTYKALYNCEKKVAVTNEQLYYYRYNMQSIMGKKFNEKRLEALDAFEERKNFYKENNEVALYEKSVILYQNVLKRFYKLAKDNLQNSKKTLSIIKKRARGNLKEYIRLDKINVEDKIKTILFALFPKMYYILMNIKDSIKLKVNDVEEK